jgi:hypothetical protein
VGRGNGKLMFNGYRILVWMMKNPDRRWRRMLHNVNVEPMLMLLPEH